MKKYEVIKKVLRTEKSTGQTEIANQYSFEVDLRANKIQIRKAVEEIYSVKVSSVKTLIMPRKPKIMRRDLGYTNERKKAVVNLIKGQTIDLTV